MTTILNDSFRSPDELCAWLSQHVTAEQANACFLLWNTLDTATRQLSAATKRYKQRRQELMDVITIVTQSCDHPVGHRVAGGQYEPDRVYCLICGAEL
jgi:hypothetical protein